MEKEPVSHLNKVGLAFEMQIGKLRQYQNNARKLHHDLDAHDLGQQIFALETLYEKLHLEKLIYTN